jgi:oligopeptide transport system ATP-binding protein
MNIMLLAMNGREYALKGGIEFLEKDKIIIVKNLVKYFPVYSRGLIVKKQVGNIHAVDNISFHINRSETFALVGESGCGKTTTARLILNLIPQSSGNVFFKNINVYDVFNSKNLEEQKKLRRKMQLIFQNPYSSLDPRMTIYDIISEPFLIHEHVNREEWKERVYRLLDLVGLEAYHAERYPHEFSGGQRQRICIARALAVEPDFIVADEPVSSLDVSIRAQILNLLGDLQKNFGLTYLYISHDLSSVRQISHRVSVMYLGKIVEYADTDNLFDNPLHPYTQALIDAVPIPDPKTMTKKVLLGGEVPSPINPPPGCRFHPRCPRSQQICRSKEPELFERKESHNVACHFPLDN